MKITVGICTWNRAELLDRTLLQMRHVRIPAECDWEVLVVNNNCSDETEDVLQKHDGILPLRRLHVARPGKSHALNAAIETIDSDWIMWTDDDVLVEPDWIEGHLRAVREFRDASFFGGYIEADFEEEPPAWLRESFDQVEGAYAVRRLGDDPFRMDEDALPYGANFAIRTDVQKANKYDTNLGRVGSSEVRGEETALAMRLMELGHVGYWNPYSKVRHFIPKERLTKDYLRRFFYGIGQTTVLMDPSRHISFVKRARYFASAAVSELSYQSRRFILPSRRRVRSMTRASFRWGRAAATQSASRRAA